MRKALLMAGLALALLAPSTASAHTTGTHNHCLHAHVNGPSWEGHYRYAGHCWYHHPHPYNPGQPGRWVSVTDPGGPDIDGVQLTIALIALMGVAGVGGWMIERRAKFGDR